MMLADKKMEVLLDALEASAGLMQGINEEYLTITAKNTDYVLAGKQLTLGGSTLQLPLWVAANDYKLSFVFRLIYDKDSAQEKLLPAFKNAQRIGWEFDFLPAHAGVHKNVLTVNACCFSRATETFTQGGVYRNSGIIPVMLTDFGRFHVDEWAHLMQVVYRQMQRNGILPSNLAAP